MTESSRTVCLELTIGVEYCDRAGMIWSSLQPPSANLKMHQNHFIDLLNIKNATSSQTNS